METRLVHNDAESRYELHGADDHDEIGFAEYRLVDTEAGRIAEFHHTRVVPPLRGRGFGERLVRGALNDVRDRNLRVRATCWFVDQFLIEHPDYADLRA